MKFKQVSIAAMLALATSAGFADTVTTALDLSLGNASFGRNNAVGSFTDTYTFTLVGSPFSITATASSAASGSQDLDFTSLVIQNAANAVVATFAGNFGNDITEFYSLSNVTLPAGSYSLVITGVNSVSQASYSGNLAITAVPEPGTVPLMLAGLAGMAFVSRRIRRS